MGALAKDAENDDWLRVKIANILRMHADGRIKGSELVALLKVRSKKDKNKNKHGLTKKQKNKGCCEES